MSEIVNDLDFIIPGCNFKWYECWKSGTADREEIINRTSDPVLLENCRQAVKHLFQPLREDVGRMSPQSWLRIEELEKKVCWKSFKRWHKTTRFSESEAWGYYFAAKSHPKFQCIDVEVESMSNDDLYYHVKKNYEFDELIREFPKKGIPDSGWVHISWAGDENRGIAKVIGGKMANP